MVNGALESAGTGALEVTKPGKWWVLLKGTSGSVGGGTGGAYEAD